MMDGTDRNGQEKTILEQLSIIDNIIASGKKDHILAICGIVSDLQAQVYSILNNSGIRERLNATMDHINAIIFDSTNIVKKGPEILEIESKFLTIKNNNGVIDILPVEKGFIVYIGGGDDAILVPGNTLQTKIIQHFLKFPNGFPIRENQVGDLKELSISLNSLFNDYGVFFGIRNGNFIIDGERVLKEESKVEVIYSSALLFGQSGEKEIGIKIYTPIVHGNSHKTKCLIGGKEVELNDSTLKFLTDLISAGDSPCTTLQPIYVTLNLILENVGLELIQIIGKGYKLAIKNKSVTDIKTFYGVKDSPSPEIDEILARAVTKKDRNAQNTSGDKNNTPIILGDNEKVDVSYGENRAVIISKIGENRLSQYKLDLYVGEEKIEISLTQKEYELFKLLCNDIQAFHKLDNNQAAFLPNLKKKLPNKTIKNKRGKGYSIKKLFFVTTSKEWIDIEEEKIEAGKKEPHTKVLNSVPHRPPNIGKRDITEIHTQLNVNLELGKQIIQIFEENPGEFFTINDLIELLGIEDTHSVITNFLIAKATYNNPQEKIFQAKEGTWVLFPEKIELSEVSRLGDVEVYVIAKYGAMFDENGEIIVQSPRLFEIMKIEGGKIILPSVPGKLMKLFDTLITAIKNSYPHLVFKKNGSIITNRKKLENARIGAAESKKKKKINKK